MFGLSASIKSKVEKEVSNFSKMLKRSVNFRKENVLIISDYGVGDKNLSTMLAYGYYLAAHKNNLPVHCVFQEPKKEFMFLDTHVIKALELLEKNSIIIVAVSDQLGRLGMIQSFEDFCRHQGHRFILITGLAQISLDHFPLLFESICVSPERLRKQGNVLKKKADKAKEVRFKTEAGTDFVVAINTKNTFLNVGEYNDKGTGGAIPAGCVWIRFNDDPELCTKINGTIVLDGSVTTDLKSILLDEPLTLKVEEGKIVSWEGKHASLFDDMFDRFEERGYDISQLRVVRGVGVGINPRSLLIGSRSLDLLALGTAYIEFEVHGRAGTSPLFLAQVFKNPTIIVDGEKIKLK
ncbi:hypothetical protein HYV86_04060 [Candidatus Woesearchaeota archaeon]|nr:hypothetical protein [Candidatus Woesearchaeota archaeon]